jgi:transcriptional regulator with XRE-family HTH domain
MLAGLGALLRRLRDRNDLTQEQVAERTGIGRAKLSKYELGMPMRRGTLWLLLTTYKATVEETAEARQLFAGPDPRLQDDTAPSGTSNRTESQP